jgi:pimeloyl-ACP methyl ester carboxylesterase
LQAVFVSVWWESIIFVVNLALKTTIYKNTTVAYSDYGKGTALCCCMAISKTNTCGMLVPEFSKSHRVITIDLLGHGKTECLGYIHTMEDQADMVHEVLQELRIRKAIFIGHRWVDT